MTISLGVWEDRKDAETQIAGELHGRKIRLTVNRNAPSQRYIADIWDSGCLYEGETVERIIPYLDGGVFFDVGAHIGFFSMLANAFGAEKVVSFEPSEFNRHYLAVNAPEAMICPWVVCHKTGKVEFYENLDNDGGHALWNPSAHPLNYVTRSRNEGPTMRQCVSLDAFNHLNPTVLKVDTEGAEMQVLCGAATVLNNPSLKLVILERNDLGLRSMGSSLDELIRQMDLHGWRLTDDSSEGTTIGNLFFSRLA